MIKRAKKLIIGLSMSTILLPIVACSKPEERQVETREEKPIILIPIEGSQTNSGTSSSKSSEKTPESPKHTQGESNNKTNETESSSSNQSESTTSAGDEKQKPTAPVSNEQKRDYSSEYASLVSEVNEFIGSELKELKQEVNRDLLRNFINEVSYEDIIKKTLSNDEYSQKINELKAIYNNVKASYKNAEEVSVTEEDLQEVDKRESKENFSSIHKNNDYNMNVKSNRDANTFMNLIDKNLVKDIEYQGYTEANKERIGEFTRELVKHLDDEFDKVQTVFNWIRRNLRYAFSEKDRPAIEPYDVLLRKVAVCGGYSNLYKAMLDSLDIKNSIVIGWSRGGDHQWNLVFDSKTNTYYHSDPTWGYLNKPVEDFARDHRAYKIIDSVYSTNGFSYEYNFGVSLVTSSNENKYPEHIENNLSIVSISESALKNSKTLYVGANIDRIEYEGGTFDIQEIVVDKDNQYYASKDGVLYNKDFTKLLIVPEKYQNDTLVLPKTVREIEDSKFSINVDNLRKIKVEPGNFWFASYGGVLYNNGLRKIVVIPKLAQTIITPENAILDSHDFAHNPNINSIIISEGAKDIPEFTFNKLDNLKEITFPSTLKTVSNNAFNQINLSKVKFDTSKIKDAKVIETLNTIKSRYKK
ncbi:leucine-rich repeat protein [Mycoplasmopsis edwardii]|uniref:Leucine-rich repeat protein n=1 Tax=Mycoplasmopsis edwardii TaxID=53558 RepID=A0ACD4PJJ1_9BACT|nr:leucine-rich repeat protein [Mycoplasmopsis edwardii]WBP83831.1 leucine-rich repeat protein [Mycoplasmopsis edwardii]